MEKIPTMPPPTARRTAITVIASLLGLATIVVLTWVLLNVGEPAPATPATPPRMSIGELRSADEQSLISYGWVDKPKGVARIPIEAAMEKVIAESAGPTTQPATRAVASQLDRH